MKRNIYYIGALMLMTIGMFSSCMDEHDTPDTSDYLVTSKESVGDTTISIMGLKDKHASLFKETNAFTTIEEDEILEGVVIANDEGGNLYQTLVIAEYKRDGDFVDGSNAIVLAIKSSCLYPYFAIGQMVRVNLKGLSIGCYSKLPKIGQPYYTSSNNLRLGPVLFEKCKESISLVGKPQDYRDKIIIYQLNESSPMLTQSSYQNYKNSPMVVKVKGKFVEGDDKTILAPDELKDAGMGVDRQFKVGSTTITVRTSTQNEVSFLKMPKGEVMLTGVMSYYSGWQLQLRSTRDMVVL